MPLMGRGKLSSASSAWLRGFQKSQQQKLDYIEHTAVCMCAPAEQNVKRSHGSALGCRYRTASGSGYILARAKFLHAEGHCNGRLPKPVHW